MKNRLLSMVTTWPFLLSLALLVLNDGWFKYEFPGVITGKLSDFAGIAVVALLLLTAFPCRSLSIFCALGLSFLWWKSPVSEPFICGFNNMGFFSIGRTVDYSDMIALAIFPLCRAVAAEEGRFTIPWPLIRRCMAVPTAMVTLFAILGTSSVPRTQDFMVRTTSATEELRRSEVEEVIKGVAAIHGITDDRQANRGDIMILSGDEMKVICSFPNRASVTISITARSQGVIAFPWSKSRDEKIDELNLELKKSLAARFSGLEYVETLGRR